MIYIAERLALIHGDATKAALIESAHSQRDRQAQFQWVRWDNTINANFGTSSGASNLLEPQPVIDPLKANICRYEGHEQTPSVGPLSRLLDLSSDCNSALETQGPYQEYSMGPFDISSKEAYYDGATEMLAVTETKSTKVITPAICTSCKARHSVESLSGHDGYCEACSLKHDLVVDQANEPVHDNPPTSQGQGDVILRVVRPSVGEIAPSGFSFNYGRDRPLLCAKRAGDLGFEKCHTLQLRSPAKMDNSFGYDRHRPSRMLGCRGYQDNYFDDDRHRPLLCAKDQFDIV